MFISNRSSVIIVRRSVDCTPCGFLFVIRDGDRWEGLSKQYANVLFFTGLEYFFIEQGT